MVARAPFPDELAGIVPRRGVAWGWTWAASLALHVVGAGAVGSWALHSFSSGTLQPGLTAVDRVIPIELPPMVETSIASEDPRDPASEAPRTAGGPTVPRVDTGRDGRGGERTVDRAATHLSDVDERLQFSQGTINRQDRDQVQRVHASTSRAAWEDRRSTTHPMELAFLSSSDLARLERRAPARTDPSRGVLSATAASLPGGPLGVSALAGTEQVGARGTVREGASTSSPGEGVRDGLPGLTHRVAAAVGHARPDIPEAPVSVEALTKARPRDDVDSEQELASKVEALVHASTAGGVLAKSGVGGSAGGGAAGADGTSGAGSHPRPLGEGASDWFDVSSTDPRIVAYFRRFHAKVEPLWVNAFPRSALLELKQGTVILDVTISADGHAHVAWPPERPSGVDEFDRNCAEAVRKASPFDPIPPELGLKELHLRAPFVAKNPLVH